MASLNNEGASFSSSTRQWEYAVFLSFRGEDTREGFTSHLYKALCNKGINTFIDDIDLPRGEEISEKLIQAIKNSSILVIVFSENFAESKWCLNELAEIVECREKDQEVQIRPIFFNVDPSEIRNQNGNFGIALANHEKKFKNNKDKDKVQRWRDALKKAANASGWHYKKGCAPYKSEADFIQNIVEEISNAKLNWMPLYVAENPVGINSRVEAIESLLDIGLDEVCVVGMYGLPGVGKTTIAKAVYNKIAKHFDGSCFLENVREKLRTNASIIKLQEQLLNDITRDGKWKVGNSSKGITLIEETLRCKKVLLILDDVDDSTPIKNFLGKCNWFAPRSRAIITLRDRHLLTALKENVCATYKVKEFEVEQLNKHEALQLFKELAFPRNKLHDEDYSKLATKFIDFANGLPRALEIIACDLCGRTKKEWESTLDMYKKIPEDIQKKLQVSYDLRRLLLYCSLFPLGYEFGKEEMVQLWIAEEFIKERQRMEVAGCEYFDYLVEVEFIQDSRYDYSVDFYSFLSDEFDSNGGKKLYKVNEAQASLLKMAISGGSYQSELGDKLDVASEFDSNGGKKLFKVNEAQASLLKMAISEGGYQSEFVDKLDVASELTRHLSLPCESINDQMAIETLKRCTDLRTLLLLSGCGYNVKQVPRDLFLSLKLLRTLNLSRTLISELPSSIGNVKSLRYLDVSNMHIRRLPESIDCLSNLQTLKLKGCLDFVALPKNMKKLTNLRHLELDIVRQLISMPNRIGNLTNLQTLSAFLVGRDDECGIEELKNMNDLCGTFCISRLERVSSLDKAKEAALIDKMYLDKLELRWSDIRVVNPEEEEEILESLRPHSGLREIQILFYGGFKIPSWIGDPSFANLVSITLYKCRNCEFLPSLGDLPSLKFLFIREMNEVKKIEHQFCRNVSHKGFAKLEKLEINVMLNLEEWMGVENGDLPVLRKLTVEYFPKLIALPSLSCLNSLKHLEIKHCSRLQCLPNEGLPTSLEFLLIKDCPELKERCCKEEGLDWGKIEHVPNIWIDHQEISSS